MKKLIIFCLLSFTAVVSGFCQTGYIFSLSGTVRIENNKSISEASAGLILKEGDTVITGRNSKAELVIDNDDLIKLGQKSSYALNSKKRQKKGIFKQTIHGIWGIVSKKFTDTEYSNAAVGTVGAIRGPSDAILKDNKLSKSEKLELSSLITMIHPDLQSSYLESEIVLIGPIFERFSQLASAETIYTQGIINYPQKTLIYEMLIDLYMNNDLYKEASDLYKQHR